MQRSMWTVKAPHAKIVFAPAESSPEAEAQHQDFCTALRQVAGCKDKGSVWTVPHNAMQALDRLAQRFPSVEVVQATWVERPKPPTPWAEIEATLRQRGEVQSWVLDGFLTEYQKDALSFGWGKKGVHFWHPTGSGKTLSGILCGLSEPGPLVIVTRAASRLQYGREVERFLNLRAYVVRPATQKKGRTRVNGETWPQFRSRHKGQGLSLGEIGDRWRAHQAKHGVDQEETMLEYVNRIQHRPVVIVGWESLVDNIRELTALGPGAVVYDESHRGKNAKRYDLTYLGEPPRDEAERAKWYRNHETQAEAQGGFLKEDEEGVKMLIPTQSMASSAAQLARATQKRICTTATPIKDRVRDLWAQLDLAEPNAWGNSSTWRFRYADMKPGKYGGMDDSGSSNLDELNERISSIAHILKYEETHRMLPKKRRQSFYVSPSDQCAPSAGFAAELREARKQGASHVFETKLAQAASGKRKAVLGIIEDHVGSAQKVVVFTARKRDCDLLGKDVASNALVKSTKAQVWVAHGAQTTATRQAIIDEYMAHPGPCVLVGTGHAFGESLNIHDTDAALFVMLPFTPGQLRQWEGRFTRLGQKRPVVIYYVIAEGTVDEHVASILIDKLPAVEDIADDTELAAAKNILAGIDENESEEAFMQSILADLDFDEDGD